jgi:hypothetical protein
VAILKLDIASLAKVGYIPMLPKPSVLWYANGNINLSKPRCNGRSSTSYIVTLFNERKQYRSHLQVDNRISLRCRAFQIFKGCTGEKDGHDRNCAVHFPVRRRSTSTLVALGAVDAVYVSRGTFIRDSPPQVEKTRIQLSVVLTSQHTLQLR